MPTQSAYINKEQVDSAVLTETSTGHSLLVSFRNGEKVMIHDMQCANFWDICCELGLSSPTEQAANSLPKDRP